jgi:hypothetical protein
LSNKWILSATEIDTFETCRRKWAYQYLDGLKPKQSSAAEFGLRVHKFLEKYLTGYSIKYETAEGRVASPGLHYLPKALPKENVERPVFFIKNGLIFHGYIDFFEQVGSQTWLIGDHKTSSNLSRVPSPAELKKNTQANVYAQWAFTEKLAESVQLKWVYYRTQSTPKAVCVETELTQKEAEENFAKVCKTADDILTIVRDKSPSSCQPKNLDACFKYGRCPFYAHCKSDIKTTAVTRDNQPTMVDSVRNDADSFHLFVDCVPTKSSGIYAQTIELAELLKPVFQKIQTEKELSHYRLAGYGQHVVLIANYLSEHLRHNAYDHSTAILSSSKTPEGCDTLQTLVAQAGCVVRGL